MYKIKSETAMSTYTWTHIKPIQYRMRPREKRKATTFRWMEYLKKHPIYLFTNRERLSFLCVVNTIHINIIKSSLIYMCLYIYTYIWRESWREKPFCWRVWNWHVKKKNQFYFYDAFNILYLYLFCLQKVISYTKSLYNIFSKRVFYNLQNCHA